MLASAIAKLYARREVVRAGANMGEKGRAVAPTDGASTPRTGSGYPRGGRLRGVRQLSSPSASRALRRKLVGDFAGGHKGRQVGQVARDAVDLVSPPFVLRCIHAAAVASMAAASIWSAWRAFKTSSAKCRPNELSRKMRAASSDEPVALETVVITRGQALSVPLHRAVEAPAFVAGGRYLICGSHLAWFQHCCDGTSNALFGAQAKPFWTSVGGAATHRPQRGWACS